MKRRPNVVIFYTDDQGTRDARCYGARDLETPSIDSLAERGVRFSRAYGHTVCCPSRASLLTGRYPQRGGINAWTDNHPRIGNGIALDLKETTIAASLKKVGYRTAIFGKWHLGASMAHGPSSFGFEEFFGHRGGFIDNYRHMFLHSRPGQPPFHDLWRGDQEVHEDGSYFPDLMVREARRFIASVADQPFFLYLPFNLPHYPYQADPGFVERYATLPYPRNLYAAMVNTVDDRIGQVLGILEEQHCRENTLIVCMSDNGHSEESYQNWGVEYGAHGGGGYSGEWTGCKETFYEGGIRVPAVISMPGTVPQGETRDQIMTNMDVFPTILELAGAPLPEKGLDGHSLWPLFGSSSLPERYETLVLQWYDNWCSMEGEWKLIHDSNREELVRLSDEQPERIDYRRAYPEIVARLREVHGAWAKDVFPAKTIA